MNDSAAPRLAYAKADCLMSALDGDVVQFDLNNEILITAANASTGCALVVSAVAVTGSMVTHALRRLEAFLKTDPNNYQIKILGPSTGVQLLQKLNHPQLRHANFVPKDASRMTALYYPASGRLRVAVEQQEARRSKIKILVVDDSKTIRSLLSKIFETDSELEVVGTIEKPTDAMAAIQKLRPDVITLDIHMPEMDGITLLKKILPVHRIPVVMITSVSREEGPLVLEALEAGAVDYIQKPSVNELKQLGPILIEKVKNAAEAKIQVTSAGTGKSRPERRQPKKTEAKNIERHKSALDNQFNGHIMAIGSSTGGTEALKDILLRLPDSIPPTVIVQHIPAGFSLALANRLNDLCVFEVKEAADGDLVLTNRVLIAPGGRQMKLVNGPQGLAVAISDDAPVNRHKPSVDFLFDSVASLVGNRTIAAILTGMGADGARGLLKIREAGGHTIAQDEESCVVYGMPREAVKLGAAEEIAHLFKIHEYLVRWWQERPRTNRKNAS